jgi:hypothetical protein
MRYCATKQDALSCPESGAPFPVVDAFVMYLEMSVDLTGFSR